MASPEKRKQEEPGPSNLKRLRGEEQNNNTLNGFPEDISFSENVVENVSKCGILKWVVVKNFMCHEHLRFEFSPHINFVKGRNGSGKSAILAAVVVGLGGVARTTNRGTKVKDLVKEGKQVATIEIGIMNCGSNAFKSELYGNSIIVHRTISVMGTGGYKMKSEEGKVIANKKDELSRMLEHFNLQVENPVTMLNQDMSRSFFNTTEPKRLFKLFMKATQLQQMKDDYAHLKENIQSSLKIIENRKECLPELETEVEEQRIQYQFSLSLREKGKKLKDLRHELAWAKIIHNEKKKAETEAALENHHKDMNNVKEKIETLQTNLEDETATKKKNMKLAQEANEYLKNVSKQLRTVDAKMRSLKNEYKDKQSQLSIAEKKARTISSEIATLRAAVEKDNNKAHNQWATQRAEWQKKINGVEGQMKEHLESLRAETDHQQNLQNTVEVKLSEKTQLEMEEKALLRQLQGLERELKGLHNKKGSQLTVYGQWVPYLLNKIDNAHANGLFTKKPIGPMGSFIQVKDIKWAHVAERVLGRKITSFCVDNQADGEVLRNLMSEVNFDHKGMPIVIVSKFRNKVLDVSRFAVTSPDYLSLWSILDISNTVVANTVIDHMQVESILLIPTAQEAGRLLKNRTSVPKNCKFAYTLNLDQYYPDPNYRVYSGKGSLQPKFLHVSVEDRAREVKMSKQDCTERLNAIPLQKSGFQNEIDTLQEQIKASDRKHQESRKKLDTLRMTLANIQNQETPPPPDIAQLEDDIRQQELALEKAKDHIAEIQRSACESKASFTDYSGALVEYRQKEKDAFKEAEERVAVLNQSNAETMKSKIETLKNKDAALKKKEKDLLHNVKESTDQLNDALVVAENFQLGSRIETKKSVKLLEREYTTLQARLNKERVTSGDPITIAEKYMATKQRYKQVAEDLSKHVNLIKKLNESLHMRESKYCRLHKWLSVIVKYFFKEHLSLRKLNGSISISLNDQTLNIQVEKPGVSKDSLIEDQKLRKRKSEAHQDLIMMSGGERSFVTVAFIIALWHAIVSPIRILDEFDVFMDVIARNRAMKMMISAAKPDTQYIFLTPLGLDTDKFPNCVFFQMPDPEKERNTDTPALEAN